MAVAQSDGRRAQEALAKLCRTYWYPLYAYVRRRGYSAPDAQDLTQDFFTKLLERSSLARATPELGKFRSYLLTAMKHFLASEWKQFAEYDLNNEMIHSNYYDQRLGKDITRQMAQWVRQGDSNAVLFVNDYGILTGARLEDYIRPIRTLLEQGVPIGGIGVQGHVHDETFDPKALRDALERLSELKLPIRVTEFNMPGQRSRFATDRSFAPNRPEEEAKPGRWWITTASASPTRRSKAF